MRFVNIKHPDSTVSFAEAVTIGLGRDRGLFFPESIPVLENIPALLEMDLVARSVEVLDCFTHGSLEKQQLVEILTRAFDFPVHIQPVTPNASAVELFHGPSLAFKDFGARFLAECLAQFAKGETTILTATSGDTGAAVAHAFRNQPGIRVVILYPHNKISNLQEKLFCTLGGNIETYAIDSDFDACQLLVKRSFEDPEISQQLQLNSANSINIARLLAQVCYYFEAVAKSTTRDDLVISVPSGNFGNLTAGLIASAMGLPVKRFVAATNANDTVPRFMANGRWEPHPTIATLTNAMDISAPNNFPRVLYLAKMLDVRLENHVDSFSISDSETKHLMRELFESGYIAEPHSALAFGALEKSRGDSEHGLFLGTAHPAKFRESVEDVTEHLVDLPQALKDVADKTVLSKVMAPDFDALKEILLTSRS